MDENKKKESAYRAARKQLETKKLLRLWLEPEEMEGVKGRALDLGLTVSDYVRQLLKDDGAFTKF